MKKQLEQLFSFLLQNILFKYVFCWRQIAIHFKLSFIIEVFLSIAKNYFP